jgi:hypothetical protein
MINLHWNYKDLFRACRLGFSAKKIWMEVLGVVVGGLGYTLITYLAYAASGVPIAAVWERFSLIPFLDPYFATPYALAVNISWWSWIIWGVALAYFLLACMVTAAAVAKVTFEQLRGDDFFESREAFKFAFQRLGVIVGAPLMPLLFAAFLVICGLILSLVGAIPEVGDIFVGLLALPAFGASLFIVYLLLIFAFSLVLVPAIAGATKNDSFDSLFEVFSCFNEQTWRLVVYTFVLAVLATAAGAILGWFSLQAIRLGTNVLAVFMGEKLPGVLSGAPFYFRISLPSWCPLNRLQEFGGVLFGGTDLAASGVGQNIGALLVGVAAYVAFLFVLGYAAAAWHTGAVIIFCVLTKKKDEKDILQEKDTEELLAEEDAGKPRPATTGTDKPETAPAGNT